LSLDGAYKENFLSISFMRFMHRFVIVFYHQPNSIENKCLVNSCHRKPSLKMQPVAKVRQNVRMIGFVAISTFISFILICYLSFHFQVFSHSRDWQVEDKRRIMVRILCYGDSLTAGFYFRGQKFLPYSKTLKVTLEHIVKGILSGVNPTKTCFSLFSECSC
jgi:hypothetical protein